MRNFLTEEIQLDKEKSRSELTSEPERTPFNDLLVKQMLEETRKEKTKKQDIER